MKETLQCFLEKAGFLPEDAQYLALHEYFCHKTKTEDEIKALLEKIRKTYGCSMDDVKKAILTYPQFAGLDHLRVVRELATIYGSEEKVKEAILTHTQFAGLDHLRVVRELAAIYGSEEKVKKAILKFPQFADLDHLRVVRELAAIYGSEEKVKKAILKFPPFTGLDHLRVIRERAKLGRIFGLSKEEVMGKMLSNPVLAGYSVKRYVAGIAVAKALKREMEEKAIIVKDEEMLRIFFSNISKSPYVPGTKKMRFRAVGQPEPQLMKAMRKSLLK